MPVASIGQAPPHYRSFGSVGGRGRFSAPIHDRYVAGPFCAPVDNEFGSMCRAVRERLLLGSANSARNDRDGRRSHRLHLAGAGRKGNGRSGVSGAENPPFVLP